MTAKRLFCMLTKYMGNSIVCEFRPLLQYRVQRAPNLLVNWCIRYLEDH